MSGEQRHRFLVGPEGAGTRLDRFVASRIQGISRSRVRALVEEGAVLVDGRPARPSHAVRAGEEIVLRVPPARPSGLAAQPIPLEILHEDEDILVLVKPAGLVVHPAAGHPDGTLVNALLAHCTGLSGIGGELRPGIVHRLDKGTSGLMVVAKTDAAHLGLTAQFRDRTVGKTYLALVWGATKTSGGEVEAAIARHPRLRRKMATVEGPAGRPSRTTWEVRERFPRFTLLEVHLHTGRTHQIRVHLLETGHPIVGDIAYAGRREKGERDPVLRKALGAMDRPFLHAWRLSFRHPVSGLPMEFESALPRDLCDLLALLRRVDA